MDQKLFEESGKSALGHKSEKIPGTFDDSIACPTPEKTGDSLHSKSKAENFQLPEKFRVLADLFDGMSCSLRLLKLRKKSPTFQNISTQVDILAKRKISYTHLAQIKFILPEAIHIDKIVVHDPKTLCMKPDMKITLLFDPVEVHSGCGESAYGALKQVFASRLTDFCNMHPEASDVPEATLPEPFRQGIHMLNAERVPANGFEHPISDETLSEELHPYQSFSRHFSQKDAISDKDRVHLSASPVPLLSASSQDHQVSENKQQDESAVCLQFGHVNDEETNSEKQKESTSKCCKSDVTNTPVQVIHLPCFLGISSSRSPDIKFESSPSNFLIETPVLSTPAQSTPRRSMPCSDVKPKIASSGNFTSCHKPAKRILNFSHPECDKGSLDYNQGRLDNFNVTDVMITQTTAGNPKDDHATDSLRPSDEVEECHCSSNEDIKKTQTGLAMSPQMSSTLLDLVAVINSVFQSVNCLPITEEELLHKIIMTSLDFEERREVEEQMDLLENIVPNWICKKVVPSGDVIYCIKKEPNLETVRSRLMDCKNIVG